MSWEVPTVINGEPPPSFIGKPPGYRGYYRPAEVERTADVQGVRMHLYRMTDGRHPWPARAEVLRLLDGFTCRQLDGGPGVDHLTTPAGLLDVVSPEAVRVGIGFALQAGRITPARADALLVAIGEPPYAVAE